ncbi:MAG: branched-chain amino acid ABC transporter ATP-binding protein/permease [Candidatus Dormibacteria bacterium]
MTATAAGAPATSAPSAGGEARPLLTPRRSNIILLLIGAVLLPSLTYRAMPLLPSTLALNLAEATALAVGALSLNLLIGYTGQVSLGQGALLGTGAFAAGLVTSNAGLPMWLALPVAATVSGLVALVVGFPALRLRGLYLAVVTAAFGYTMYNSVLQIPALTGGSAGVQMTRRLFGSAVDPTDADLLAGALVVLLLVWLIDSNITRTSLGRAFRAIRENEAVAGSFGVDVSRTKLVAFVLSGAIAGVGGALFGFCIYLVNSETFLPAAGLDYSLYLIIIVVIGGLGSRAGTVAAAFTFQLFAYVLGNLAGDNSAVLQWIPAVGAALLMYTVARHPNGLAGLRAEIRERRRPPADASLDADAVPSLPSSPSFATTALRERAGSGDVLVAEDVSMHFGGLVAVDGASIRVPRGQIVGLIGPNGAGKTTFFNCLSGLLRPDSGRVQLNGVDVSALPAHRRAGLGMARTFQQIGLAKDRSVLENMLLAQHVLSGYSTAAALVYTPRTARSEEEMRARARAAVAALGFDGREDVPVRLLSGGQQRIVEVACALLTDPDLLMLDEPSAGMAPAAVESLTDRLRELRDQQGRTVLLIEHNVPMVFDLCDVVYVLNAGRILASGTPAEILAHPDVVAAYLGEAA